MKIKTVVIVNDFNYIQGGASKVAIDTAKLLNLSGKDVYFFSAVSIEKENINGVKYISTHQTEALKDKNRLRGFINGIYNFKAKKEFSKLLDSLDKDSTVIHIHGWTKALSSSVFDVAFKKNFKVLLTSHDYFTACPNGGYFNYKKNKICNLKSQSLKCMCCNCDSRNYIFKLYRLIRQFVQNQIVKVNKKIKYVIGISDKNIEVLKRTLNKEVIIKKIRNPIDIEKIQNRILVENNDKYLYIGRVAKEKGVEIFCDVISKMGLNGLVIGDGSELKRLEEKYKNIEFTGWKNSEQIKEYLKQARMFIFPSLWYEGAPLTPLEVMSYGIPCVVSNCSSATEYIKNQNGEIFDPYKEEDLNKKINMVNKNIKFYSESSYKYVNEYINNKYIDELLEFYEGEMND